MKVVESACLADGELNSPQGAQAFIRKVNDFVVCNPVSPLKSLEFDGTGTLIGIHANTVRKGIDSLLVSVMARQQQGSLSRDGCGLWQQEHSLWHQNDSFSQGSLLLTK